MNLREKLKKSQYSNHKLSLLIATGGLVGFIPPCPGTYGALQGLLLYGLLKFLPLWQHLIIALMLTLLGIISSEILVKNSSKKDPDEVIIDEIAGAYLACLGKENIMELTLVLIVFRIIDIKKPFPLKNLEKLRGGLGIMLDDVLAGIITNILVILIVAAIN